MRLKVIVLGLCFHLVLCEIPTNNKLPSDPPPNTGANPSAFFDHFSAGYKPDKDALPPSFRSPQEGVDPAGSLPSHQEFKPPKESHSPNTGLKPSIGSLHPNTGFKPSMGSHPSNTGFKPSAGSLPKTGVNPIKTPSSKPVDKNAALIKRFPKYANLIQNLFKNMQVPPIKVRKSDGKPKKAIPDLRNNNLPTPGKPDGGIKSVPQSDKPKSSVKTADVGTQTDPDPFYTAHLKPKLKPGCHLKDLYAKCYLKANPTFGQNPIKGTIYLRQMVIPDLCEYDFISIQVNVKNGPERKGRSVYHGFHVHEYGDMEEGGCEAMGGHYNPFGAPHGSPRKNKYNRHVGDLGNVRMNSRGRVRTRIVDYLAKLYGPTSIVGRGFVLHADRDDLGQGKNEGSLKTGNAGRRLACCTIVRSKKHSGNNYTLYGR